jgi:hypothetical protein
MPPAPTELAALARTCLDHLHAEEVALQALSDSLAELHGALRQGDQAALMTAAARHALCADKSDFLTRERDSLRRTAAAALGLPYGQTTLTQLGQRLPLPWSDQIKQIGQRLRERAEETRGLARRTGAVLSCCQSFTRQLLAAVCGPEGAVDRYGPSGAFHAGALLTGSVAGVM